MNDGFCWIGLQKPGFNLLKMEFVRGFSGRRNQDREHAADPAKCGHSRYRAVRRADGLTVAVRLLIAPRFRTQRFKKNHRSLRCSSRNRRRQAIRPAFEALLRVVDEAFPVDFADTERARDLVLERESVSARDALHVAVMERERVERILSFDTGFDDFPGIQRVSAA